MWINMTQFYQCFMIKCGRNTKRKKDEMLKWDHTIDNYDDNGNYAWMLVW